MVRMLRSPADSHDTHRVQSLSAIQELVDAAKGAGIEITTAIELNPSDLSDTVDVAAYRILQESITNIVRHSQATRAQVKRSEEHTSELQSRGHLVCRLLLEKKKT